MSIQIVQINALTLRTGFKVNLKKLNLRTSSHTQTVAILKIKAKCQMCQTVDIRYTVNMSYM